MSSPHPTPIRSVFLFALRHAPLILFACVTLVFGLLSDQFFSIENWTNILIQSTPTCIIAIGMTFVLLTAGVDLSVGAIMFVAAAVAGKLLQSGQPITLAIVAMLATGAVFGSINAFLTARLRMAAFIVTLAMLFVGRGLALWLTQTRAINLPESFLEIGTTRLFGIPSTLILLTLVAISTHLVLTSTRFGRHLYAVGNNVENARKAGIATGRVLATVYVICGFCAALGAIVSLTQLGAVSPKFGENYEFKAIAAAVLGGTSLFGGRGAVLPGTVLGAVLIQCIDNGLVLLNADPYLYPPITAAVIFTAVLLDSTRNQWLLRLHRRRIRRS